MILYRTAGAWGPGVGANLSAAQVDGNFYDVATRVQYMELNAPRPIQITSFDAVGNIMYINMSDGSVHGPITLPTVKWFFRGEWLPDTVYSLDDVITAPDGSVYLTMLTHISGASFNAGENDGQGHNFYSLVLHVPGAAIPTGGNTNYVLTKNSGNNYDVSWSPVPAPPGGNAGEVLKKNSEGDGDADWDVIRLEELDDVIFPTFPVHGDYLRFDASVSRWVSHAGSVLSVLRETSWSPVLGDNGSFMVLTNGTADTTVFLPRHDNEPFPIGTELHVHQDGTGKVRVTGDAGVNVLKHASFSDVLLGQYATATAKKTANYEWRLFGLLAAA